MPNDKLVYFLICRVFPLSLLPLFIITSCNESAPLEDVVGCEEPVTSHDFIWEVDSLGTALGIPGIGLSVLNDMAVVSEENVWVVGKFYLPDTSNSDSSSGELLIYNAIHWDGEEWDYLRLLGNYRDQYDGFDDINAIQAFAPNDVWALFAFGAYAHWDGENWDSEYIWEINGIPSDMWGTSPSNFYIVGYHGSITHYDGTAFRAMDSGTSVTLTNIWGLDEDHIWVIGYDNSGEGIINPLMKYDAGSWVEIHHRDGVSDNWPPEDYSRPSGTYLSTWAYGDTLYLGCASLWKESISTGEGYLMQASHMDWNLLWGVGSITGNHCNDIFAFMAVGLGITHYNGETWQNDTDLQALDPNRDFQVRAVDVKENVVFIAGTDYATGRPLLIRGYRQ